MSAITRDILRLEAAQRHGERLLLHGVPLPEVQEYLKYLLVEFLPEDEIKEFLQNKN